MTIEVNIVNDVIEFAQRDSWVVIVLALSTLGLAIITTIALVFTLHNTKKSNEELKKSNEESEKSNEELKKSNIITERMLELTHRPIIELNYQSVWWFVDKKVKDWDGTNVIMGIPSKTKVPVIIKFKLSNQGVESAQNIIASYHFDFINSDDENIDLTRYKNKFITSSSHDSESKSKNFDLDLPAHSDEEYEIKDEIEVLPSTKCIFTFEISYTFLGDGEGYVQYIFLFTLNHNEEILFRKHLS